MPVRKSSCAKFSTPTATERSRNARAIETTDWHIARAPRIVLDAADEGSIDADSIDGQRGEPIERDTAAAEAIYEYPDAPISELAQPVDS